MQNILDTSSLDITVSLLNDNIYEVSGPDACKLYQKMQLLPDAAKNLNMSDMADGAFTFTLCDISPVGIEAAPSKEAQAVIG